MKNISAPIFAMDFEGSKRIGIVEYGVVEIANGEIVAADTRICAPREKIPQRDAEFFGIDNAKASSMPPFEKSLDKFCDMRKRGIFAAHNAVVEDSFLRDALPSPGIVKDFIGAQVAEWAPWIDTCALIRNIYPSLQSAKLAQAIEVFGLLGKLNASAEKFCPKERRKWHCALYDALASAHLLMAICSQDGFEQVELAWLLKYSGDASAQQTELF